MIAGLITGWAIGFIMALWIMVWVDTYEQRASEDCGVDPYSRGAKGIYKDGTKDA